MRLEIPVDKFLDEFYKKLEGTGKVFLWKTSRKILENVLRISQKGLLKNTHEKFSKESLDEFLDKKNLAKIACGCSRWLPQEIPEQSSKMILGWFPEGIPGRTLGDITSGRIFRSIFYTDFERISRQKIPKPRKKSEIEFLNEILRNFRKKLNNLERITQEFFLGNDYWKKFFENSQNYAKGWILE